MAIKNSLMTGITDLLVLSILREGDAYAYDISKTIHSLSNDAIAISLNTIYTAIYKLEREGYVTEYSKLVGKKRTRVYYHLEETGHAYTQELLDNYVSITDGVHSLFDKLNATNSDLESTKGDKQ